MDRKSKVLRFLIGGLLALVSPVFVLSGFMAWSESLPDGAAILPWYIQGILILAPGLIGIEILPVQRMTKAILTAIYVPLMIFVLIYAALAIACGFYSGCL